MQVVFESFNSLIKLRHLVSSVHSALWHIAWV